MLDHRHISGIVAPALALAVLLLGLAQLAPAAPPAVPKYRDLKVYTTSAPDATNAAKIVARTEFQNHGAASVRVAASLKGCPAIKFKGARFTKTLAAGKSAVWTWSFSPPEGVQREILTGAISLNGKPERDLYLAVLGPDPADYPDKEIEPITERARVVATYAPRTRASIRRELSYRASLPWKTAKKPAEMLTLAADGKTDYAIVVEVPTPSPVLTDAVADLRRCLEIQSGVELPVTAQATGPAIRLRLADLGKQAQGLQDAYRLFTWGKDVIIEANSVAGLSNGVYGLLTDHLDCHWFQPKQLGEEIVIPKDRAVRLPEMNEVRGSDWFSTGGATWGYDRRWDRRNRAFINEGRMNFGHSWEGYINKGTYPYEKFPKYYAQDREGKVRIFDNSWSKTNFCTTNPEVLDLVAKKVNTYFANDPNAVVASLDPNDYAPMCLCENCLALDKKYGQTREDGTQVADRLLHFSQEIYNRLDPKFKDRYLGILIYGFQMDLPKSAKPHEHHAGLICNMTWRYDATRPWNDPTSARNREFAGQLKDWGSMLSQLGYYDYYGNFDFFGPWGIIHKMREDLPAFRDAGGTFLMLETQPVFAAQGLNHYVAGRLMWDADADVDLLMEEFFLKYYGPAAEPMRAYWLAIDHELALERPGTGNIPRPVFRPEFWKELEAHLEAARQSVANLPPEQKRFADRVQLACAGLEYGGLNFEYRATYGDVARGLKRPIDHAAAITFLQDHRARVSELLTTYSADSAYWPLLLPVYFHPDVDAMIKGHEEALTEK